ncbi:hypothetical protein [Dysgonomonas termitidis]|uniref:Uncharacterized protein n=1 Tax=Dysgonomonas termitidis TaxID=1516126 RepID=A0ABV9KZK8_9BACT
MQFGDAFYDFCELMNIGKAVYNQDSDRFDFLVSEKEFKSLLELGNIYDGRKGGLVLGKLHKEGGVHFIQYYGNGMFKYTAEMEGWEYLTGPILNTGIGEKFEGINSDCLPILCREEDTSFKIPQKSKIIDTSNSRIGILLLSEHKQFIVNRFSTRKHINRIIEIDEENDLYNLYNNVY